MKSLPLALILSLLALDRAPAATVIRSADEASVASTSDIAWKQLRYVPSLGGLVASITFTNEHYISDIEPRRDERFDFAFPGVTFDAAHRLYWLSMPGRKSVPVAELKPAFIGSNIELKPGWQLKITNLHGQVTTALISSTP